MKRVIFVSFFLSFVLWSTSFAEAETFTCLVCHGAMKGKIRTETGAVINLNVDGERYASSVHGGFDCLTCHKQFSPNPHEPVKMSSVPHNISSLAAQISKKAKVDSVALSACIECHEDVYMSVIESVHGQNIIKKKEVEGPLCLDCHGSPHYIMPKNNLASMVHKKNIVKVCGDCHEKDDLAKKYDWGTHLLERYYESFHGKKYIIGHPNAPACSDCHGSHSVKAWNDPASPVAMDNRTETCGKCHKGATKKFVTAITHKHIGKDNPIPYYFGKGLTLLLLSVFAFILGHVVLEAFSEIRDRVFRKEGGHHE